MTGCGGKDTTCLAHVDERAQPVDERHEDVEAGREGLVVAAEPLDDPRIGLRDDADRSAMTTITKIAIATTRPRSR